MGIRGLTTYICRYSDTYLENHELQDTYLVIDTSSLGAYLYRHHTKANDAFGGDYDKLRKILIDFFVSLKKCNITPLCILDGGFEYKKLKTLYSRMKNRVQTIKNLNPSNQKYYQLSPLLQMEIVKDTLRELDIKMIMCDFEADFQIASVARFINCPVLSFDSDYFIYDCLYIPLNTLDMLPRKSGGKYYLNCKLFRIDTFLNRFGGLDKSLLPLMATLLGNDYVKKSTFDAFFAQLKLPQSRTKMNDQQRTIAALLNWLRPHNFQSARERVLSRVKMHLRPEIARVIDDSVEGYTCSSEYILNHFGLVEGSLLDERGATYTLADTSDYRKKKYKVPHWFIEKYRVGLYPASFINLITKQTQLFTPQMEDISLYHSHHICLDLIKILFGLLTSPKQYKQYSYITRERYNAMKFTDEPVYGISGVGSFPPLNELRDLSKEQRDNIFFNTLQLKQHDLRVLSLFPESWRLVVVTIIYWARNINDLRVTSCHLYSLILGLIHLKYIDEIVGFHRSQQIFQNKYGERLNALQQSNHSNVVGNVTNENLHDLIAHISEDDALLTVQSLIGYFNMDEKLFNNPKNYTIHTVHCFAEFQAAYRQIMYLNCLLDYPLHACSAAQFYNGTFIYNMYSNLKRRNNLDVYLNLLLGQCTTVMRVFNKIIELFRILIPEIFD